MVRSVSLGMQAGTRFTLRLPAGEHEAFGPEPFTAGQGFTVDVAGERWRAILLSAATDPDGSGVSLEVELSDRTPIGYGATPAQ
jgi:hypothetical protein